VPSQIDPSQIPGADLDPDMLDISANQMRLIGSNVSEQGGAILTSWQRISASYEAPEAGTLFAVMNPVKTHAELFGTNVGTVADALNTLADEIRPIKAKLAALAAEARSFVSDTRNGVTETHVGVQGLITEKTVEWHEDSASVNKNNALIADVGEQMVLLWAAERACANTIYDVLGYPHLEAATDANPNGYGVGEIPDGAETPWGTPVEKTEDCGEKVTSSVASFVWDGVIVGGIWGTVTGLGTLVLGYNPATGEWFSGDAYGAAWSNLGMLGVGIATAGPAGLLLSQAPGPVGDFVRGGQEALVNAGKGLIAYDQWGEDPWAAAGTATFNIASILVPAGAAVGAVKTGAGTASAAIRATAAAIDIVDPAALAVRGAGALGRVAVPAVSDLLRGLDLSALDTTIDIPPVRVPDVPAGGIDLSPAPGGGWNGSAAPSAYAIDAPPARVPGDGAPQPVRAPVGVGASTATGDGAGTGAIRAGDGSGAPGAPGHGAPTGSGGGRGDAPATGSPDSPSPDSPSPDLPRDWDPEMGDPVFSDADRGPGFERGPEHRGDAVDPAYGQPRPDAGTLDPAYGPPATVPESVRHLVLDPEAPYGRGADGAPYTKGEWESRYMGPDDRPRYPGNDGATPGTRYEFTDVEQFQAHYGESLDRMGGPGGNFFSFPDTPFEYRALPGSNLSAPYFEYSFTGRMPETVRIEVSEIAPAFGQPGGGLQVRLFDTELGRPLSATEALSPEYGIITRDIDTVPGSGALDVGDATPGPGGLEPDDGLSGGFDPADLHGASVADDAVAAGDDAGADSGAFGTDPAGPESGGFDIDDAPDLDAPARPDVHQTLVIDTLGDGKTPELLRENLAPNTRYEVDGGRYVYETDELRRVAYAEGTIDQTVPARDRVRNGVEQTAAGVPDRLAGDHGGHFFATRFGGPSEGVNLTAMRGNLNQSGYKKLENAWAGLVARGHRVDVRVVADYEGTSLRPSSYRVWRQVDGGPLQEYPILAN